MKLVQALMIKDYLILVRLPNLTTIPSNIIVGYLAVASFSDMNFVQVSLLTLSSALVYIAGIVFNDVWDLNIDSLERPSRPLPSNKISKQRAQLIAVACITIAIASSIIVGITSFVFLCLVVVVALAYDFRLKRTIFGPAAMGCARVLNILLGASPFLFAILLNSDYLSRIIVISISTFLYIMAIAMISKNEAGYVTLGRRFFVLPLTLISVAVVVMLVSVPVGVFRKDLFINLVMLIVVITVTCGNTISSTSNLNRNQIQRIVKFLVIYIIILDSAFVSGLVGVYYGLSILLLILAAIFLAKGLYVT
jgi:4-hydroxybenzoate polyprenyltransferase